MRLFRCKHRRLSWPCSGRRHCLACGAVFAFDALTLTEQDKKQATAVTEASSYDSSNVKRKPTDSVVRSITRKQVKP